MKFGLGLPGRDLDLFFKTAKDNGLTGLLVNQGLLGNMSLEVFKDRVTDAGLEIVQWAVGSSIHCDQRMALWR